MNLSILSGPVIGALIGYGTNWIAIKMLFRPINPIKIGKFTLPFTPGIIPRRKDELAKAIGNMVGNTLFTKADLQKMLLSEEIENNIVENIVNALDNEINFKDAILEVTSEEDYIEIKEKLKLILTSKIKEVLIREKVSQIVINEGKKAINANLTGMLKMIVNEKMINGFLDPMEVQLEAYIQEKSDEIILSALDSEIVSIEEKSVKDISENINKDRIIEIVERIYKVFVEKYFSKLFDNLNISNVVEEKINAMDVLELEKLILSVIKKELNAIVNLGAFIGLMLGCLNIIL